MPPKLYALSYFLDSHSIRKKWGLTREEAIRQMEQGVKDGYKVYMFEDRIEEIGGKAKWDGQ